VEQSHEPSYSLLSKPLASCVLDDAAQGAPTLLEALEPLRSWITESVAEAHRKITLSSEELVDRLRQAARENLDRLEDDPERAINAEYGFLQFMEKVLTSPPTTIPVLARTLDQPQERVRDWISEAPENAQTALAGRKLLGYLRDLCAEPEPPAEDIPRQPLKRFDDLTYLGNLRKAFDTLYAASTPKPAQAEYIPQVIRWLDQRQTKGGYATDVILVAPTNGGKNGIILAAALAAIAHDRGPVIVLQPYRAQISESRRSWQDAVAGRPVRRRGVTRGVEIAGSSALISSSDYRISRGRVDITAIIPEKLAVLTRDRRLTDFCRLLVVDEISHLIDPERGAKLEILLTLARASRIPLFATGAGLAKETAEAVARWLGNLTAGDDPRSEGCLLYNPELRRDPPIEYCVWRRDGERRFWKYGASLADQQPDSTEEIETQILPDAVATVAYRELQEDASRQILVFLEDREGVLELADSIASRLQNDCRLAERLTEAAGDGGAGDLADIWLGGDMPSTVQIPRLLRQRVGVHTRDVPSNNIENIESAFRGGQLRVLCATRTVEAGINLPVDTVIQVGLNDHNQRQLPQRVLDQRLGRSGRTIGGKQTSGRGIVYIHDRKHGIERVIPTRLLQEDPAAGSQMNEEYLALLLLTSIGAVGERLEKTEAELQGLIRDSFWAKERPEHEIQAAFRGALSSLQQKRLVETSPNGLIRSTPLGKALASGLLTPEDSAGIAGIAETAESEPPGEAWLGEVLLAACQVPSIARAKRRPREQDVIVRSPLTRSQVVRSWCRIGPGGQVVFGVPGKGSFSLVAGRGLQALLDRVLKETASPAELRVLLRAYVATAWTRGFPVEFPRHIGNLNEYIVAQDLGYYLAHVLRAGAWFALYGGKFLLNLRLLELAQQVELGVRVEALDFMDVCGEHVERSDIAKRTDLEFERLLEGLAERLADDLKARLDFLRRRRRDREERLALDDKVFGSREEQVALQRAETAAELRQRLSGIWQGGEEEFATVDASTFEVRGTRIRYNVEQEPEGEADVDIVVTMERLDAVAQRSREKRAYTLMGSEEFLVFFSLLSALVPLARQVLFLTTVGRLHRVAQREVLRGLYAEITASGRYSAFEDDACSPLTLNSGVLNLLRSLQLLYSDVDAGAPTQAVAPAPGTEGVERLREQLLRSVAEVLSHLDPLIRERSLVEEDARSRGVPAAKEVQESLSLLRRQQEEGRDLKRRAEVARDHSELKRLEEKLAHLFDEVTRRSP
jgi:replicative superfamily II helicase